MSGGSAAEKLISIPSGRADTERRNIWPGMARIVLVCLPFLRHTSQSSLFRDQESTSDGTEKCLLLGLPWHCTKAGRGLAVVIMEYRPVAVSFGWFERRDWIFVTFPFTLRYNHSLLPQFSMRKNWKTWKLCTVRLTGEFSLVKFKTDEEIEIKKRIGLDWMAPCSCLITWSVVIGAGRRFISAVPFLVFGKLVFNGVKKKKGRPWSPSKHTNVKHRGAASIFFAPVVVWSRCCYFLF